MRFSPTANKDGGGSVGSYEEWWSFVSTDEEHDSSLFFLASDGSGAVVAVAHCWRDHFLKDIVVAEHWRRRGLAEALLLHVFRRLASRGGKYVDLKLSNDNPSGADRLYRRVGMEPLP